MPSAFFKRIGNAAANPAATPGAALQAPDRDPRGLRRDGSAPATPAGSSDVSLPDAARPPPCEPMPSACGPSSPCPTPGNRPPPANDRPGDCPFAQNLQGPKNEGVSEAPASAIPSDPRPCGQDLLPCPDEWLPHDLGHDLSPSLSDLSEAADSDASLGPLAGTVCADCGELLQDSEEMDEHIARHRPAPPSSGPLSPPGAPTAPAGPGPDPAACGPSPSTPPDPAYPYACKMCRARYKTERGLRAHVARLGHFTPLDATIHQRIGVPSGSPSPDLLQLLSGAFTELARQLPPAQALARFLATCRRMEGSGQLPPSQMLLRRGHLGRAWQALLGEADPAHRLPEPRGEERARIVGELHPAPLPVSLPPVQHTLGPAPKVTAKGLEKELRAMKAVAAGPSGLAKAHLLHLCAHAGAAEVFATALAQLLASKDWAPLGPLAEFRLKLLPKPGGKWRPIAVQETLLVAFHRLLLRQTPALRRLPPWQLAFEHLAQVKAVRRAEELKRTHHLHTVDVRNAFNSVPHPVILFALHRAGVPLGTVEYVASFLAARRAPDLPSVPAGVPQGDPLSMAMFCQCLVWPVEASLPQYKVIAYADDLVLAAAEGVPADRARADAQAALATVGLTVEPAKCTSTQAGAITFMGTKVLKDAPFTLAQTAARRLHEHIAVLRGAGLSRVDRLRLLSTCVVPAVNYGPMVDEYPGPSAYADVDAQVTAELAVLLEIPEALAKALALTPRAGYGLGLVLPNQYYTEMQEQRRQLKAGVFREMRKRRIRDAAPLRSFLPLALLQGPPLDDAQALYVGDCLAGRYRRVPPMGICCHCRQPLLPRHHLVCKAINGIHVARHEKLLEALLAAARGRPGHIARNPAIPTDHLQPDLIVGSGFGDLVVTVPWRMERSYALKAAKYRPLVLQGRASHILPIVVGTDGTLHPLSAAGLAYAGVDLHRFAQAAAQIILWHFGQSARLFLELRVGGEGPAGAPPLGPATAQGAAPAGHGAPRAGRSPLVPDPPRPSCSPSVEIVAEERPCTPQRAEEGVAGRGTHVKHSHSDAWRAPAPAPPAPLPPEEPSEPFVCSRAPSPPPLEDGEQASQQPGTSEAEPRRKALPPIFRRVDAGQRPPAGDPFCPFKRIPTKA